MTASLRSLLILGGLAACSAPPSEDQAEASIFDAAFAAGDSWQCSSRVELSSLWAEVRDRHDHNGDGQVTLAEYDRGEVRFRNYDRNEDGLLDSSDFPEDAHFNGFNPMILGHADSDGDQQVTRAEWSAFQASLDADGDGRVVKEEVQQGIGGWTSDWPLFLLSFDQDGDQDFDEADLEMTFRDRDYNGDGVLAGAEMAGWQPTVQYERIEPPAPGEIAPDFELAYAADPARSFRLHDPARTRPVALIFGSYT